MTLFYVLDMLFDGASLIRDPISRVTRLLLPNGNTALVPDFMFLDLWHFGYLYLDDDIKDPRGYVYGLDARYFMINGNELEAAQ